MAISGFNKIALIALAALAALLALRLQASKIDKLTNDNKELSYKLAQVVKVNQGQFAAIEALKEARELDLKVLKQKDEANHALQQRLAAYARKIKDTTDTDKDFAGWVNTRLPLAALELLSSAAGGDTDTASQADSAGGLAARLRNPKLAW